MTYFSIKKIWSKNGILVIVSLIFSISVMEIGLRLAGISYPTFSRFSPDTGDSLLPGAEGWYMKEGRAYIRINSDGLRDREHIISKQPGTLRIAVLGDSYAEAMQIPINKTFWATLERELESCKNMQYSEIEVINFGVSGYGTAQELLTLRHKAWKYNPDIVLLAFVTGNDIRNNSKELQRGGRPYFVFQNNKLILDNSFMDKPGSRLRTSPLGNILYTVLPHSRIMQLILKAHATLRQNKEQKAKLTEPGLEGLELGLDSLVYKQPETSAWNEAWNVTEDILRLINTEIKDKNAQFLLVTLSSGIQVNPNSQARKRFREALDIQDLLYPDRRIEALANKEGMPFLMLVPTLAEWAETHNTCVHGFPNAIPCSGHWNEHGHQLASELIAARICEGL